MKAGKGVNLGAPYMKIIPHYPILTISSSHPPYFSLTFCEHEGLARVFKIVFYFENTLFFLWVQIVHKILETSRCFLICEHHL